MRCAKSFSITVSQNNIPPGEILVYRADDSWNIQDLLGTGFDVSWACIPISAFEQKFIYQMPAKNFEYRLDLTLSLTSVVPGDDGAISLGSVPFGLDVIAYTGFVPTPVVGTGSFQPPLNTAASLYGTGIAQFDFNPIERIQTMVVYL